jgi:ribosomal protein S18 acetylase RimI-like enzyme
MSEAASIVAAHEAPWIPTVRTLFAEYAAALGIQFCFQGFDEELRTLPGKYAPPAGRVYLALSGAPAVGCIALRPLAPGVSELKRMYVRPAARGTGLGRRLAEQVVADAHAIGYGCIRLDTLRSMTAANRLYESLGFREVSAYYDNPLPDVRYMELSL